MYGVQPQPVHVVVAEPLECVVDEEAPDVVTAGSIQVHCVAPRRVVAVGQVRPEFHEVVAVRPEVVVDHVQQDGQPSLVGRIHETFQSFGSTVRVFRRIDVHAVVAPSHASGELTDRHQFQVRDPKPSQIVQPFDGSLERSG